MHYSYTAASLAALTTLLLGSTTLAASDTDVAALQKQIQQMRGDYEARIQDLESKLNGIQRNQVAAAKPVPASVPAPATKPSSSSGSGMFDNRFNPAIGVILNGKYGSFSKDNSSVAGFATGEEGERPGEGFNVDESELNFSANIDDKFSGYLTAAIVPEDGETKIELEEAFVQTAGGTLPYGLSAKAGRFLADIGYLNSHHDHTDDFADRPLPYRVFLNNAYNDDGVAVSMILPTDFYSEIGAAGYRGDDFPYGSAHGSGIGSWSAFARVGGELSDNIDWRLGTSLLKGKSSGRLSDGDNINFTGDTTLYIADARLNWAPTGNPANQEVTLQGEYMLRRENSTYEDIAAATGAIDFDGNTSGLYVQSTYKFLPQWRVGARYSMLDSAATPAGLVGSAMDADGFNPESYAVMTDWSNSEFSRLRLQFAREEATRGQKDNQVLVQYIMSLGAHGAHSY